MKIEELEALCRKRKDQLIRRFKSRGMCENFGDKEIREISEAALSISHDGMASWADRQRAGEVHMAFFDWATTYTGRE